jgi:hypothetical protein
VDSSADGKQGLRAFHLLGPADRYLEKPLRVDQLIATATALIGRGRPLSDDLRRGNLPT